MTAIFKREWKSYFVTPVGYVYLGIFSVFAGIFFYYGCLLYSNADIEGLFNSMLAILLYLLPVLTMRLFTEERKNKTDQLLLTAPVSSWAIVLGKFLAAFAVFLLGALLLLLFCGIMAFYSSIDVGMMATSFLGFLLLGAAMIAIGTFISCLTESTFLALIITFAIALFLTLTDTFALLSPWNWLKELLLALSFTLKYQTFSAGLVEWPSVLFFLSATFLFLFYGVRSIERRQYRA